MQLDWLLFSVKGFCILYSLQSSELCLSRFLCSIRFSPVSSHLFIWVAQSRCRWSTTKWLMSSLDVCKAVARNLSLQIWVHSIHASFENSLALPHSQPLFQKKICWWNSVGTWGTWGSWLVGSHTFQDPLQLRLPIWILLTQGFGLRLQVSMSSTKWIFYTNEIKNRMSLIFRTASWIMKKLAWFTKKNWCNRKFTCTKSWFVLPDVVATVPELPQLFFMLWITTCRNSSPQTWWRN